MNLPNKLTISRIIMIPIFVALFFIDAIPYHFALSAVVFAIACFTDLLDGHIARKYKLVTNLGKFLDPIADKILVSTALIIMLVPVGGVSLLPSYASIAVALILARELMISGFRMVSASKGLVLPADMSGKIKTCVQDGAIVVLLVGGSFFPETYSVVNVIGIVILGIATVLTVYSGARYIIKNKHVLKDSTSEKSANIGKDEKTDSETETELNK